MKNTDANDEGQPWHCEDDGKVTTRQLCWPNLYDNTLCGDEDHVAMSHISMAASWYVHFFITILFIN